MAVPLRSAARSPSHPGGALVVSNHSGGLFAMDVPVFATGFYDRYGYERPVYTLSFDLIFTGPTADFFRKTGCIPANHENADEALRTGGVVVVFPGGDYDGFRPTTARNKIDFGGHTWPNHIVDVKRALAWVKENIADYGGDPDFVAISGGSTARCFSTPRRSLGYGLMSQRFSSLASVTSCGSSTVAPSAITEMLNWST